jgi:hypothetical protein
VTPIEIEKRATLSVTIVRARAEKGWSREQLAVEAEAALRQEAGRNGNRATREERDLWEAIDITQHAIRTLEGCPSAPLASPERRARLLGVALALGLDRALVNRLAGGV